MREPPQPTRIEQQMAGMSLKAMPADLPTHCAVGCKRNAQGYTETWIGYKLHLVERVNARINDDFGARRIQVRGHAKVLAHLMFGVLALTAEQLMRWLI
ncbi:MAG: hypothetical protein LBQ20_03070 [Rhodanobacter sp.]|nr:hypothetical protein [Rhodanobacter sp.]